MRSDRLLGWFTLVLATVLLMAALLGLRPSAEGVRSLEVATFVVSPLLAAIGIWLARRGPHPLGGPRQPPVRITDPKQQGPVRRTTLVAATAGYVATDSPKGAAGLWQYANGSITNIGPSVGNPVASLAVDDSSGSDVLAILRESDLTVQLWSTQIQERKPSLNLNDRMPDELHHIAVAGSSAFLLGSDKQKRATIYKTEPVGPKAGTYGVFATTTHVITGSPRLFLANGQGCHVGFLADLATGSQVLTWFDAGGNQLGEFRGSVYWVSANVGIAYASVQDQSTGETVLWRANSQKYLTVNNPGLPTWLDAVLFVTANSDAGARVFRVVGDEAAVVPFAGNAQATSIRGMAIRDGDLFVLAEIHGDFGLWRLQKGTLHLALNKLQGASAARLFRTVGAQFVWFDAADCLYCIDESLAAAQGLSTPGSEGDAPGTLLAVGGDAWYASRSNGSIDLYCSRRT